MGIDDELRERFAATRVARLATADRAGKPHLVPVTFAALGDQIFIAIDHKPKTTTNLKRLRNIAENSRVSLLADEYDDRDWSRLWWVRADGHARIIEDSDAQVEPIAMLCEKYAQYREVIPAGPVIHVQVLTWHEWKYSD